MASKRDRGYQTERNNWAAWMRYKIRTRKDLGSAERLAKALGIGKSTLVPLLDPNDTRAPSFETFLASSRVARIPLDQLVSDPPSDVQETPMPEWLGSRRKPRQK